MNRMSRDPTVRTGPAGTVRLRLKRATRVGLLAAVLAGTGAVGCQPAAKPSAPQQTPLPSGADVSAMSADVLQRAKQFQATAQRVGASDGAGPRSALREAFADLADLLPRLAGPKPSGALASQFQIVAAVRDQIGGTRPDRAVPPGVLDNGLDATRNALRELGQTSFYADPGLQKKLDELSTRVSAAQAAPVETHLFYVRDAVAQSADVVLTMATAFNERVASGGGAEAGPAAGAGALPAAPATDATAAPSTVPSMPATPALPVSPAVPAAPAATEPSAAPTAPAARPAAVPAAPAAATPPAAPAPADPAVPVDPAVPAAPPAQPPSESPGAPATPPAPTTGPAASPPAATPPAPFEGNK